VLLEASFAVIECIVKLKYFFRGRWWGLDVLKLANFEISVDKAEGRKIVSSELV
jgi:hypothetical protein